MAIRTPEEYLESIRDDRVVYCRGEQVHDVMKQPDLAACARMCTIDYIYGMHPDYKDLFTAKNEEGDTNGPKE